ncbi:MAG: ribonuclease HII [Candidatus Helarchaeota archaeon]|nr:ribonuclease HII [Candidatus Helarchaeota archaeon]
MPIIAGVEEAGRGPVIGPMVMAIAVIDSKNESQLRKIGVKDSKQLTPKRREELFKQLMQVLQVYKFTIIPPKEIDAALNSDTSNLNWLEADKSIELVKLAEKEFKIDEIFIDCPSSNIDSFKSYLNERLNIDPTCLVAEHKADQTYPIVSAASIIAKVIRDREIQKIQKEYQVEFGSGYTSDERTITFLKEWVKEHKTLPEFVRKSWVTVKKILEEKNQRKLDEY